MLTTISSILLNWYRDHARALPWRGQVDSYAVWVSEIMLQQTRVETVIPYFARWMERFPSVHALAEAPLQDVLALWEGLGYYSRARNLYRAAQIVVAEHSGQLPRSLAALRRLPGIGRYTAGAIASIAFGLDEPALDANIRRVYARVFDMAEPARSPAGERRLWALTAEHLPPGQAGAYNQALMDLGAMVCTPRNPDCVHCPLADRCLAYARGVQAQRPVDLPKPVVPHITVTAAVIRRSGRILLAQRPLEGLLGGLWEFPGGKLQDGEDLPTCLAREICEELGASIEVGEPLGVYRHAYTHFRVTLHAFDCRLLDGEPQPIQAADIRWITPEELANYPMGKIDRQISKRLSAILKIC
ncbi:MAG: A/G-specific adenine glycosylase [Chloroflexota bacterium]